ncbi:MAG: SDR family oxidoreductase [Candidatus Nanopelagicales bacterium]
MSDVLFTGFPGFLGSALLPLVLARRPGQRAVCLVQDHFRADAQERLDSLTAAHPDIEGRVDLVTGDITEPGLGIDPGILGGLSEVFHLAAVYDLAVAEELAHRVNVTGTHNVIEACRQAPDFQRLQYVSTCYVSGTHHGLYTEADLDTGQSFANHYEHTKFEAEQLVRDAMADGLPATIYRPGIVVGDSRTGETQKYDGPYFLLQFLIKQPGSHVVVPQVADPDRIQFSLVPRDFVVTAIDELSVMPDAVGKTYALTDPDAPTVRTLVDEFCRELGKSPHWVRVPLKLTTAVVGLPGMEHLLGFPQEGLPYFAHPTVYDTTDATRDLARVDLACPEFVDYAPAMVAYVKEHPEVSSSAMV